MAKPRGRANIAGRRAAAADFAAQFHQGLVEAADVARRQHGLGRRPKQLLAGRRRGLAVVGQQPAEDPHRVGFQDRPPLVEGDGEDRPRRVAANARQSLDRLGIAGEAAVVVGDDLPGGLVELPRAAIVAQSFPKPQDLLLIGLRQRANRGQGGQKPLEVRLDGFHLRLLEHDFAQPDGVRVAACRAKADRGRGGRTMPAACGEKSAAMQSQKVTLPRSRSWDVIVLPEEGEVKAFQFNHPPEYQVWRGSPTPPKCPTAGLPRGWRPAVGGVARSETGHNCGFDAVAGGCFNLQCGNSFPLSAVLRGVLGGIAVVRTAAPALGFVSNEVILLPIRSSARPRWNSLSRTNGSNSVQRIKCSSSGVVITVVSKAMIVNMQKTLSGITPRSRPTLVTTRPIIPARSSARRCRPNRGGKPPARAAIQHPPSFPATAHANTPDSSSQWSPCQCADVRPQAGVGEEDRQEEDGEEVPHVPGKDLAETRSRRKGPCPAGSAEDGENADLARG